jgi:hypothetical protein
MNTPIKISRICLVLIFFPLALQAQDWQNICSSGTAIYNRLDLQQRAIRWDTLYATGTSDTVFESFPIARISYYQDCIDTTGGGIFGKSVTKRSNGWFWFNNLSGDTIFFNALANVNDSWTFFHLSSGDYIEATVELLYTDIVLGIPDQVKVIVLRARNSSGNIIPHPFNLKVIELSKTFGFTRIYDLQSFPTDTVTHLLAGRTDPQIGIQELSWTEVITFDVGDEFHYSKIGEGSGGATFFDIIKRILEKVQYGNDSVDYLIEHCEEWVSYGWGPPTYGSSYDSSWLRYYFADVTPGSSFDRLPLSFAPYSATNAHLYNWYYNQYGNKRKKVIVYDKYVYDSWLNNCWVYLIGWEDAIVTKSFTEGLGSTYYRAEFIGPYPFSVTEQIVYYKKGTETWGTPVSTDCITLVPIEDKPPFQQLQISIFPNPASTTITIETPSTGHISIFNSSGQELLNQVITEPTTTIDVSELSMGVYLVKLLEESGVQVGKFVKK